MAIEIQPRVRLYVTQRLRMKGDGAGVGDAEPLFSTGRLDSLDAVEMIMFIEEVFGINFAEVDFDLTRLESIDAVAALIDRTHGAEKRFDRSPSGSPPAPQTSATAPSPDR
jgi:acyl carrier protein